jgi:hypothetical protein
VAVGICRCGAPMLELKGKKKLLDLFICLHCDAICGKSKSCARCKRSALFAHYQINEGTE